MKLQFKSLMINIIIAVVVALVSCQKENSNSPTSSLNPTTVAVIGSAALASGSVAVSAGTVSQGDSIYAFGAYDTSEHADSITFSQLPSAVAAYLNNNYPGYSNLKAFSISNSSGEVSGYIAVIVFNGTPVAIEFDVTGTFVEVLELREGRDLLSKYGYHQGGCFQNRNGLHQDTLAIKALPVSISSYISTNYPKDTLLKVLKTFSGKYIVLGKDINLYATIFDSTAAFINREQLPTKTGRINSIDQNALPANVLNYLGSIYRGYVFDKSFSISRNGILQGYWVVIDANNTKYGIEFDSAGKFVRVKSII